MKKLTHRAQLTSYAGRNSDLAWMSAKNITSAKGCPSLFSDRPVILADKRYLILILIIWKYWFIIFIFWYHFRKDIKCLQKCNLSNAVVRKYIYAARMLPFPQLVSTPASQSAVGIRFFSKEPLSPDRKSEEVSSMPYLRLFGPTDWLTDLWLTS